MVPDTKKRRNPRRPTVNEKRTADDFNPFHDPHKWNALQGNPFGSPIVLGFQLEARVEYRVSLFRRAAREERLIEEHGLRFANYQFSFADVVRPGEPVAVDIKPTVNRALVADELGNRVAIRKGEGLALLGHQMESKQPLVLPDADFSPLADLEQAEDRSYLEGGRYFLKRKFMNTSNGRNFVAGALVDQHYYFDELENRVQFPGMFPVALLSCALLEKARPERYDFYRRPMVYTSHAVSIDRVLLGNLKSNDRLHILVQGPEAIPAGKGLGNSRVPQSLYHCYGLVRDNAVLYRAKVFMTRLEQLVTAYRSREPTNKRR